MNYLKSTLKEWFEQLQLIPVKLLNGKKAFDTYALIDRGRQITFILDKFKEFLVLPCNDPKATTIQSTISQCQKFLNLWKLHPMKCGSKVSKITTTYSTPCLNVAPANTFEHNQFCDAFKKMCHFHFPEIAEGKNGALLRINTSVSHTQMKSSQQLKTSHSAWHSLVGP